MGKGNKRHREHVSPNRLQRLLDRERGPVVERMGVAIYANDEAPQRPTEYAEAHGQYEPLGNYSEARNIRVNRGGTPIARWTSAGKLTDTQVAAINHCIRLWDAISTSGGLVANLDRTVFGSPGDGSWREIEARDSLKRICGGLNQEGEYEPGYVPGKYWSVFESVCRFDEPAGYAGSRLTEVKDEQVGAARLTVQFVADIVYQREHLSY